jgi:hypothetical protein
MKTFEIKEPDFPLELLFKITIINPGRPAPICQNSSHPNYSDSGDPIEYHAHIYFIIEKQEVLITNEILYNYLIQEFEIIILQKIERLRFDKLCEDENFCLDFIANLR